ncbi:MAG: hypothetical protein K2X35_04980 [Bryobacteraceae bacterium]|nr:hypothetical protein [Bryobacteraceae bacterium]
MTNQYPADPDVQVLYRLHPTGAQHLADLLDARARRELRDLIQHLEREGYDLTQADGTLELMVREALSPGVRFFEITHFEVSTRMTGSRQTESRAEVAVAIQDQAYRAEAEVKGGAINALDVALRKCLAGRYPAIANVKLTDYRVRILDAREGTAARAEVLIGWADGKRRWVTAGVSDNVVHASWLALVDAMKLELIRLAEHDATVERVVEEYCWGV